MGSSMRAGVCLVSLAAALSGCTDFANPTDNAANVAAAENGFPVKGEYHRISDRTVNGQLQRMETDGPLDASTRESFERLVAGADIDSCRDRHADIANGSFSVSMTCTGYGGSDATLGRHGSYSKNSIDITYETAMGGVSTTETVSYRLNDS
jgi:hypothetical protein